LIVASPGEYVAIEKVITEQNGITSLEERKQFAARAFQICAYYDIAISNYFNQQTPIQVINHPIQQSLRYGENPHQKASFHGDLHKNFSQLHGKEISYNNLVDIDAAIQLIREFDEISFAIIKHTNVCGAASRRTVHEAWKDALAGDPESAFGGVLVCNGVIDKATAEGINEIFFEVLIAQGFSAEALHILKAKKNRILLQCHPNLLFEGTMFKSILNGALVQDADNRNFDEWKEVGGAETNDLQKADLKFANIICKHLKSNAIALVKNKQLIGKGCGQTSRIDSLRHSIEKAKQFNFSLQGAVMASDAFFPFNDSVKMGHEAGIVSFIQPGGSVRDNDSIAYCKDNNLSMVFTGVRHFKH
jgi:phosphoribosylaminoimidazolecarboxamide formyltransferase/IMP cyclohydrolase